MKLTETRDSSDRLRAITLEIVSVGISQGVKNFCFFSCKVHQFIHEEMC